MVSNDASIIREMALYKINTEQMSVAERIANVQSIYPHIIPAPASVDHRGQELLNTEFVINGKQKKRLR